MTEKNPFIKNEYRNPNSREEAYFDMDEEDALHDAYSMLRDADYSPDDLEALALLIERTTIYDREGLESYYEMVVKPDRE